MSFEIIAAVSVSHGGIGCNNTIPWYIPADMRHFKQITTTISQPNLFNAVIMGRKTYESLHHGPLIGRLNIVITSRPDFTVAPGVHVAHSLESALQYARGVDWIERIFIIGGGAIYEQASILPECQKLHITWIESPDFPHADVYFPNIATLPFREVETSTTYDYKGIQYRFATYEPIVD